MMQYVIISTIVLLASCGANEALEVDEGFLDLAPYGHPRQLLGDDDTTTSTTTPPIEDCAPRTVYHSGDEELVPSTNNFLQNIAITDSMKFSFQMTVNSLPSDKAIIFYCGTDSVRMPGIWLLPDEYGDTGIHGVFSNVYSDDPYTGAMVTFPDETYDFEIIVTQSSLVWKQDDTVMIDEEYYPPHATFDSQPCFIGDPSRSYPAADVVLRNFKIIEDYCIIPTAKPTPAPTPAPTDEPTEEPTPSPTAKPTASPTTKPTGYPTVTPTPPPPTTSTLGNWMFAQGVDKNAHNGDKLDVHDHDGNGNGIVVSAVCVTVVFALVLFIGGVFCYRRRRRWIKAKEQENGIGIDHEERDVEPKLLNDKSTPNTQMMVEMETAEG